MKGLTTTKVTHRDIAITVYSNRFDGSRVLCCASSLVGQQHEDGATSLDGSA